MKTRIISGIVMCVIVAAVLTAGTLWEFTVISAAVAVIAAVAVYEILHTASGIDDRLTLAGGCIYSAAAILLYFDLQYFLLAGTLYFLFSSVMVLKNHKVFSLDKIAAVCGFPIIISFAFFCLVRVIKADILYHFLLILNFSSVCDMGAYFVGVTLGRHKLCPEISPKKTVEGAVGGIVASIAVSVIIGIVFNKNLLYLLPVTVVLCIVGMVGDLFASSVKRAKGIKDYGNLIPGHGGILDRMDSILIIAPFIYFAMSFGVI